MRRFRPRSSPRRRLAWVLWLALLLPLAQSAAALHAYSHGIVDAGDADAGGAGGAGGAADGKSAAHGLQCELCLAAAAISGGALLAAPPVLPLPALRHVLAAQPTPALWLARLALAYRSRAPPALPG